MPAAPGQIGRYKVERQLGKGAFAEVFSARDLELNRQVVIKIEKRFGDRSIFGVENEGNVLATFQHPAILTIYDAGKTTDVNTNDVRAYIVLEYAESGPLKPTTTENTSGLSLTKLAQIFANVADAVDYMHRRGYLHRNMKTRNILLDNNARPRLSGFGLAVLNEGMDSSAVVGTPHYMAPEQIVGNPGPGSDIWALGVSLYECLTGKLPFGGSSPIEMFARIRSGDFESPSRVSRDIPEALSNVCLKCMSHDPADRYQTGEQLAEDLRVWQANASSLENRRVFVSHSTRDREFVEQHIVGHLEKNGIKTWYSKVDIQTATEWERSIIRGLESCDWFMIVMSPQSANSEWVKDELHWAVDHRPKKIVPVLIEDCSPRDFHIRMARIQYADFRTPTADSRNQLLSLFRDDADETSQIPPQPHS